MQPEQLKKTPEEIVQHTGWGFLVHKSTEPPKLYSDQIPTDKLVSSVTSPPPQNDH